MVSSRTSTTLTRRGTWDGFCDLLPVAVFSLPFGLAFGAAAVEAGLPPEKVVALSVLVFSGAAQFATLDFVGPDVAWASLSLIVLAVSARHIVMGAALSGWLNALPRGQRFATVAWLSDPNFARSHPRLRDGASEVGLLLGGGLALWVNWVAGTVVGALAGDIIGDVSRFGFDVVMVAFFAAMVAGAVRGPALALSVLASVLCVVVTHDNLPAGWAVLLAALVGAALSLVRRE